MPSMNTYVVFSLSPVRLLLPIAAGILQLLLSLLAQMKLRQLRLPLLHAQRLVIHLSLGLVLRGISDSLPRTVLVHETLLAIALMTVASLKIAHVRDSPLAIVQATDGDSLQEIPLLLSVGIRPVPPLMMTTLRDPHHGILLPLPLLLPGKIGTLMIPPSLPPFGRWTSGISGRSVSGLLVPSLSGGSSVVGSSGATAGGRESLSSDSRHQLFLRRLGRRLGGPSGRTPCLRPLVSSSDRSLLQHERAVGSSLRPPGLRTSPSGTDGGSVWRQYHLSRFK